jgi:uncharacterized protein YgiM (DUF1202 family)
MQTEPLRKVLARRRSRRAGALAVSLALLLSAGPVSSQSPAPSPAAAPTEQALVPTSYANVHKGSSSGQVILVLVPRGTVMPILGRRGEWVQVQLKPELRKTGMVMRWYENETSGWMHDSTVKITRIKQP